MSLHTRASGFLKFCFAVRFEFFLISGKTALFFEQKGDSIILRVRLSPNASSCSVRGLFVGADGLAYLKINVIAVPEKGKANQELIKFLGRLLRLPKSEIKLIGGETDRCKKLQLPFAAETVEKLKSLQEEA